MEKNVSRDWWWHQHLFKKRGRKTHEVILLISNIKITAFRLLEKKHFVSWPSGSFTMCFALLPCCPLFHFMPPHSIPFFSQKCWLWPIKLSSGLSSALKDTVLVKQLSVCKWIGKGLGGSSRSCSLWHLSKRWYWWWCQEVFSVTTRLSSCVFACFPRGWYNSAFSNLFYRV